MFIISSALLASPASTGMYDVINIVAKPNYLFYYFAVALSAENVINTMSDSDEEKKVSLIVG